MLAMAAAESENTPNNDSYYYIMKETNLRSKKRFDGHTGDVFAVAVWDKSDAVITGGADHVIHIWSRTNPSASLSTLTGHTDSVNALLGI
jgi:WD40 repeat protein